MHSSEPMILLVSSLRRSQGTAACFNGVSFKTKSDILLIINAKQIIFMIGSDGCAFTYTDNSGEEIRR